MRGKEYIIDGRQELTGITPAYAGKRAILPDERTSGWDHPRVCGEKSFVHHPL